MRLNQIGSLAYSREMMFVMLPFVQGVELKVQDAGNVDATISVPKWWRWTFGIRQLLALHEFEHFKHGYLPLGVQFNITWKYV